MKHEFSPNIMKKSKYQQYFHFFIVCILLPLPLYYYHYRMYFVLANSRLCNYILISPAFRHVALIKRKALIRGRRLLQCRYP